MVVTVIVIAVMMETTETFLIWVLNPGDPNSPK